MLRNADGLRASERKHAVEDVDSDRDFGVLPGIGPRPRAVADDLLKPADRGLDSATSVIVGGFLAADPAMPGDALQMQVALRWFGLSRLTQHRCGSRRRDDCSAGMALRN